MPLLSTKEVVNLKFSCIPLKQLKRIAKTLGIDNTDSSCALIKRLLDKIAENKIDEFIRINYNEKIQKRR